VRLFNRGRRDGGCCWLSGCSVADPGSAHTTPHRHATLCRTATPHHPTVPVDDSALMDLLDGGDMMMESDEE
jgi:hypothetical protein